MLGRGRVGVDRRHSWCERAMRMVSCHVAQMMDLWEKPRTKYWRDWPTVGQGLKRRSDELMTERLDPCYTLYSPRSFRQGSSQNYLHTSHSYAKPCFCPSGV